MKNGIISAVVSLALGYAAAVAAQERLVRFEGGIGVIPVSRAAGTQNADGTFPNVVRNDVRGTAPGGQPWVISRLSADVMTDGRISVDGRGLLLAGGDTIGTNGNQFVRAKLFCGSAEPLLSDLVRLEANGDFRIEGFLKGTTLPTSCETPVLLIVNADGRWFAAGIQKL